jgi:hypothetical protein
VCPSLRIGWALQNVEKGIRDTVFIGQFHLNLLAVDDCILNQKFFYVNR